MNERTLGQLAELILKRVYGGQLTHDRHITERQVMLHVLQVRDQLVVQEARQQLSDNGYIDGSMLTTFTGQQILWDTDRDIAYLMLPAEPADLPDDKGIYSIRGMKGKTADNKSEFVRIPTGSWDTLSYYFEGRKTWEYVGAGRVEFPNVRQNEIHPVLLQIVETGIPMDPDSPLNVPTNMEDMILRSVLQLLGVRQFDNVNDQ